MLNVNGMVLWALNIACYFFTSHMSLFLMWSSRKGEKKVFSEQLHKRIFQLKTLYSFFKIPILLVIRYISYKHSLAWLSSICNILEPIIFSLGLSCIYNCEVIWNACAAYFYDLNVSEWVDCNVMIKIFPAWSSNEDHFKKEFSFK